MKSILNRLKWKDWHLGDYITRNRASILDIKELPRYKISSNHFAKELTRERVKFPQPICNHVSNVNNNIKSSFNVCSTDCINYYKSVETCNDIDCASFFAGLSNQWHNGTKNDKIIMLSQWIT